jgi:hypothetical protein
VKTLTGKDLGAAAPQSPDASAVELARAITNALYFGQSYKAYEIAAKALLEVASDTRRETIRECAAIARNRARRHTKQGEDAIAEDSDAAYILRAQAETCWFLANALEELAKPKPPEGQDDIQF